MSKFDEIFKLNVNGKTEKKSGLTYLSWAWAWAEFMRFHPDATYEVVMFDGIPYAASPLGFMVFTKVKAGDITHEMWLPVMDGANKAMKSEPYSYKTKYGEKFVEAATMFDVNKTIMRCLVKNLAMFGLGLYIYAGEDLPETDGEPEKEKPPVPKISGRDAMKEEFDSLTPERQNIVMAVVNAVTDRFNSDDVIGAYDEYTGLTDNSEKMGAWYHLPSNVRSALTKHKNSLPKD